MEESERYGRDCPLEKKFRLEREGGGKEGEGGGENVVIVKLTTELRVTQSLQEYAVNESINERETRGSNDENRLGMKMSV